MNEHLVPLLTSYYLKSTNSYYFWWRSMKLHNWSKYINFRKDTRGFRRAVSCLKDVSERMCHLHNHGKCHADFKSNNVLIDEADRVSICDFCFAQTPLLLIENFEIAVIFCPPEAIQTTEGQAFVEGFPLDRYILVIVILEMFPCHSSVLTVAQQVPLKFRWSSDIYPALFGIL